MPMMEWNESYSVHVVAFDKEHKELFKYFNEFYDAMMHDKGSTVVGDVLAKTCNYAVTHFRAEEAWMEKNKYPELAQHREEHRKFAEQATKLLKDAQSGRIVLSGSVSKMLREWLTNHIMGSDKKYAEFAIAHKIV